MKKIFFNSNQAIILFCFLDYTSHLVFENNPVDCLKDCCAMKQGYQYRFIRGNKYKQTITSNHAPHGYVVERKQAT